MKKSRTHYTYEHHQPNQLHNTIDSYRSNDRVESQLTACCASFNVVGLPIFAEGGGYGASKSSKFSLKRSIVRVETPMRRPISRLLRGLAVSSKYARMRAVSWGETRLPATILEVSGQQSVWSCWLWC